MKHTFTAVGSIMNYEVFASELYQTLCITKPIANAIELAKRIGIECVPFSKDSRRAKGFRSFKKSFFYDESIAVDTMMPPVKHGMYDEADEKKVKTEGKAEERMFLRFFPVDFPVRLFYNKYEQMFSKKANGYGTNHFARGCQLFLRQCGMSL